LSARKKPRASFPKPRNSPVGLRPPAPASVGDRGAIDQVAVAVAADARHDAERQAPGKSGHSLVELLQCPFDPLDLPAPVHVGTVEQVEEVDIEEGAL